MVTEIAKMRLLQLVHERALGYSSFAPFQLSEHPLGKIKYAHERIQLLAMKLVDRFTKLLPPNVEISEPKIKFYLEDRNLTPDYRFF